MEGRPILPVFVVPFKQVFFLNINFFFLQASLFSAKKSSFSFFSKIVNCQLVAIKNIRLQWETFFYLLIANSISVVQ